jgi:hypothetical protein
MSYFLKGGNINESLNQSVNNLSLIPLYCKLKQSNVYYNSDIDFYVLKCWQI